MQLYLCPASPNASLIARGRGFVFGRRGWRGFKGRAPLIQCKRRWKLSLLPRFLLGAWRVVIGGISFVLEQPARWRWSAPAAAVFVIIV
eukprot:8494894-Pyramimonas_sp.AAC.1